MRVNLVNVVVAVFWVVVCGGTLFMLDNISREMRFTRTLQDQLLTEIRKRYAQGAWRQSSDVHNNCYADRTSVTCTFTNMSPMPVETCARGTLSSKGAQGVKLDSLVVCTGRLEPNETRMVSGPWLGGFADDICYRETSYGKSIDWSKCNFSIAPVDVPALRSQALAHKQG